MTTRRSLATLAAVLLILVVGASALYALRSQEQPTRVFVAPSSTPTATSTPGSLSPTPTATASPTPVSGRYVSLLGYSIELPPPWHRSSCSGVDTQQTGIRGGEEFWSVSVRDETGSDIGVSYPVLRVFAEANPQNLTPRQWAEQGKSVFTGIPGDRIEDVMYAERPAARLVRAGVPPTYYVANAGRMYVVNPFATRPPIDASTQQTMVRIIDSFRFLMDAELAAARAALPTAPPPRTPEQVADGVAAAFTAKDAAALAGFLSPCVNTAGEQAGSSFVSREKYVDDLRAAFAAGLVVTVRPRPLDGDRASGNLTAASSWQDSRGTKDRKLMLYRGENDRWEWQGTIERF